MSWLETIGKNLVEKVEVVIGDNKTTVNSIGDGNLEIKHYYKDILQKTENEIENKYYNLDKQTYTQRELPQNIEAINKHPECITEKYDTINWNDLTYTTIIDIMDYIHEDYITGHYDGYCYYSVIYNNIIVSIENDSDISSANIQFKYVRAQIDECDLNAMKKTFGFLNKDMYRE